MFPNHVETFGKRFNNRILLAGYYDGQYVGYVLDSIMFDSTCIRGSISSTCVFACVLCTELRSSLMEIKKSQISMYF